MLEIGSTLREARTRAGLDLASIEAATMIPARYLEALENEQFERLPVAPYRRSFLREYARYLGLDASVLDAEYELRYEPPEPEPAHPARAGLTRAVALDALTPGRLAALAGVALVALAAWLLGSSGGSNPSRRAAAPPAHHSTPAVAAAPPARPAATLQHPAAPSAPSLTLVASRGPCWLLVQIGSAAGRTVYMQTLQAGRAVSFGLRKPLWIRVGAPWNLDVTIGRRSVTSALPAQTGDVIATVRGLHGTS
jgi:transcriptional regulator with XRE-family HTH domain